MVSFHTNFTHIAQDRGDVGGGGGGEREMKCTEGCLATSQTATMELFVSSQLFSQKKLHCRYLTGF